MSEKYSFNLDALEDALERDNAILLGDYNKVTKRTRINFKCSCGKEYNKVCLDIVSRAGAFCKECTTSNATIKLHNTLNEKKEPVCCTLEALYDIIKRDNAELIEDYKVITVKSIINFRCNCGEISSKNCKQLIQVSGAFCKECTKDRRVKALKETNIRRYGVECTVHAPGIKEKIIENNIKKYGVENLFKSKEIRNKIKETINDKYGVEHIMHLKEIKDKIKKTNIKKYGVENVMYDEDIKNKLKQTNLERYGVEHSLQNEEIKNKTKQTILNRYGVDHNSKMPEFVTKTKATFMKKYGVDNPNKTKEVRDKIKKTTLERYGVEHTSQSQEIMEKTQNSAKKYKEYLMPSGKVRKVQGYEPFALDILNKLYTEDDIKTDRKEVPRIKYTTNDKCRYYFPDIYIPSKNQIIEVKSTWTYKCKNDNIKEKTNATKEAGYEYEIWVFDSKGNRSIY